MNVPAHLEPLRRSKLMDECEHEGCNEVTDLQITLQYDAIVVWQCWRCQGLPELTLHKQCEGCNAWFVGTVSTKRCGHGPQCQEQPA